MIACYNLRSLNYLNQNFMHEPFYRSPNLTHRKGNLFVHFQNIANANKSFGSHGEHTNFDLIIIANTLSF